ncbi:hypothetical protein [Pasteuria penetrans]|uniref:hypothetical protein n=1 Tax=Pasteuria penetrans TaxID=86005 RepID=UPI000FA86390|nr:hypothetical protein [Pasteuria penetrans]
MFDAGMNKESLGVGSKIWIIMAGYLDSFTQRLRRVSYSIIYIFCLYTVLFVLPSPVFASDEITSGQQQQQQPQQQEDEWKLNKVEGSHEAKKRPQEPLQLQQSTREIPLEGQGDQPSSDPRKWKLNKVEGSHEAKKRPQEPLQLQQSTREIPLEGQGDQSSSDPRPEGKLREQKRQYEENQEKLKPMYEAQKRFKQELGRQNDNGVEQPQRQPTSSGAQKNQQQQQPLQQQLFQLQQQHDEELRQLQQQPTSSGAQKNQQQKQLLQQQLERLKVKGQEWFGKREELPEQQKQLLQQQNSADHGNQVEVDSNPSTSLGAQRRTKYAKETKEKKEELVNKYLNARKNGDKISVSEFAIENGIPVRTFYYWLEKRQLQLDPNSSALSGAQQPHQNQQLQQQQSGPTRQELGQEWDQLCGSGKRSRRDLGCQLTKEQWMDGKLKEKQNSKVVPNSSTGDRVDAKRGGEESDPIHKDNGSKKSSTRFKSNIGSTAKGEVFNTAEGMQAEDAAAMSGSELGEYLEEKFPQLSSLPDWLKSFSDRVGPFIEDALGLNTFGTGSGPYRDISSRELRARIKSAESNLESIKKESLIFGSKREEDEKEEEISTREKTLKEMKREMDDRNSGNIYREGLLQRGPRPRDSQSFDKAS